MGRPCPVLVLTVAWAGGRTSGATAPGAGGGGAGAAGGGGGFGGCTLVTFGEAGLLPIERFGLPVRNVLIGLNSKQFWSPGSTLKVKFDNRNPLAYGMPEEGFATFLIARKATMVSLQLGEGKVGLIGFRAQHRSQTHGTFKLVFNALVK